MCYVLFQTPKRIIWCSSEGHYGTEDMFNLLINDIGRNLGVKFLLYADEAKLYSKVVNAAAQAPTYPVWYWGLMHYKRNGVEYV